MFGASVGGGVAASSSSSTRPLVYRHPLLDLMIPLLGPLSARSIRRGWWSPLSVALAGVLLSWQAGRSLGSGLAVALGIFEQAASGRRRPARTYQGFVKARARWGADLLGSLGAALREATRRAAGDQWRIGGFVPIAVDGTRIEAPKTVGNEPLGFAGVEKCRPQMTAVLLLHLGARLPWTFEIGDARDAEQPLMKKMIGRLPAETLLIADAGYVGYDLLSRLREQGQHFLVRVGSNVRLLTGLGGRREGRDTLWLWPLKQQSEHPPLRLRLIRLGEVWLMTSVLDPHRLSKAMAGELYRRRWGIELCHRTLKQTLAHRRVRSGAAANARAELAWAIVGLWVLLLLGSRAIGRLGHAASRVSAAAVLEAVRSTRALRSARELGRRLRAATIDGYSRRPESKHAYQRANKRTQSPPGPPRITPATRAQIQHAQALRNGIAQA